MIEKHSKKFKIRNYGTIKCGPARKRGSNDHFYLVKKRNSVKVALPVSKVRNKAKAKENLNLEAKQAFKQVGSSMAIQAMAANLGLPPATVNAVATNAFLEGIFGIMYDAAV